MRRSERLTQKPRLDYSKMVNGFSLDASTHGSSKTSMTKNPKRSTCSPVYDFFLLLNIGIMCAFALSSYAVLNNHMFTNLLDKFQ